MDKEEIKRKLRAKAAQDPKLKRAIAHAERSKVEIPVRRSEPVEIEMETPIRAAEPTAGPTTKPKAESGTKSNKPNKPKNPKRRHSAGKLVLAIFIGLTIVALVGMCVYMIKDSFASESTKYEALKTAYDSLLKENEASGAENLALKEEIDALYEENERLNVQLSDLESIIGGIELKEAEAEANPYDDTYVSEYYVTKKKSWNLIENVTTKGDTTDFIEINDKFYYAIYSPKAVTINKYDSNKELISSEKADVSQGQYYDFGTDCEYVTLSYSDKKTYFVSTGILTGSKERPDRGNYFYVVGKNAPANVSLSYAGRCLKSGGTILVLPGTYIDNVDVQNKTANIIGVDKNLCSLISYDKDYYKPPLEVSAGKIANLTIEAVSDGRHDSELSAYGIHADFNYLTDKTLTIDNCVVKSDYNSSFGIGLRRGTITISNCVFDDIFFHDSADADIKGEQNIKLINNSFTDMTIHSQEREGAKINVTFKNNKFKSLTTMNAVSGGSYEGYFKGLMGFTLTDDSSGNSVADVNY